MTALLTRIALAPGADLEGFRTAARGLIAQAVPPDAVVWTTEDEASLFGVAAPAAASPLMLPKAAADLIGLIVCHSDPQRYSLLYALVWRMTRGERALLDIASDPLVHRLHLMAKAVRRDLHKMHAFVRFRRLDTPAGERFVAWFEPDHFIIEATAGFFVDRFRGMDWAILTPKGSLHWDGWQLVIGPPADRTQAPAEDDFESHWLDYYETTFNPARLNTRLMKREMPVKYWKNLPEAATIARLAEQAPERVREMVAREAAQPRKRTPVAALAAMGDQAPKSLEALNRQIAASSPPEHFAPRAVLGEGPIGASIAFVGEQPGDHEDLAGRPFVGPAGQLLDKALAQAGVDRREAYVTNAVKNFKFAQTGKRRLHKTPTTSEVKHYRWWLEQELNFVRPHIVVALGATAALALTGKPTPVMANRGPVAFDGRQGFITIHPSYLLRLPDPQTKDAAFEAFVGDLRRIRSLALSAT